MSVVAFFFCVSDNRKKYFNMGNDGMEDYKWLAKTNTQ